MRATTVLKGLAFATLTLPAQGKTVKYYHVDAVGSVRVVTDAAGAIVERHDYLPFGEECTTGGCTSNPGLGAGEPRKYTGKERDKETGLDYFGARYYGARTGRFTAIDPVYTWNENLLDPQRWNRYAYVRNNPLRYVDPDGRVIETPWDVVNLGLGLASLGSNVAAGNVGGAIVDAVGIAYDATATAVPGLPGGAGTLIKGIRAVDKVADVARAADKAGDAARAAKKALAPLPALDRTGKVHGALPKADELGKYSADELQRLQRDLRQSVQERIRKTAELGPDKAHGQRQGAEQQLIRQIEKRLDDRK